MEVKGITEKTKEDNELRRGRKEKRRGKKMNDGKVKGIKGKEKVN